MCESGLLKVTEEMGVERSYGTCWELFGVNGIYWELARVEEVEGLYRELWE